MSQARGQVERTSHAVAVDCSDSYLAGLSNCLEEILAQNGKIICRVRIEFAELPYIGARSKYIISAGEDNGLDVLTIRQRPEGCSQLIQCGN